MIKVAINGYGRIGRNILRALYESERKNIKIVAINAMGTVDANAHLTKYDTTHGTFEKSVTVSRDGNLLVEGEEIRVFSERNPENLPWGDLGVDIVLECTGAFNSKEKASLHLKSGAKKVLISAPAINADKTIVYGVNHHTLNASDLIVSNASCTTNCLAPLLSVLTQEYDIESALMTTIHAVTNDQVLTDVYHKDLRRARSAFSSIIPTKTGAAKSISLIIPKLDGKVDGYAVRVPTINVSAVDLSVVIKSNTTVEKVNSLMKHASESALKGVLSYNDLPLVSVDFNHNSASCIFDAAQTRMIGNLLKVYAWYDNEWAFSNRMLDTAEVIAVSLVEDQ